MAITLDGTSGMTLPGTGTGVQLGSLTAGTSQASTSGTAINFTDIPSWVKRITVMAYGVSTTGTSSIAVRLGTASGIASTGYFSMLSQINTSGTASATSNTTGFFLSSSSAPMLTYGTLVITLVDPTNNYWLASGTSARDDTTDIIQNSSGGVALSGTLTQVQITTLGGTDTFDAGSINILYE